MHTGIIHPRGRFVAKSSKAQKLRSFEREDNVRNVLSAPRATRFTTLRAVRRAEIYVLTHPPSGWRITANLDKKMRGAVFKLDFLDERMDFAPFAPFREHVVLMYFCSTYQGGSARSSSYQQG